MTGWPKLLAGGHGLGSGLALGGNPPGLDPPGLVPLGGTLQEVALPHTLLAADWMQRRPWESQRLDLQNT